MDWSEIEASRQSNEAVDKEFLSLNQELNLALPSGRDKLISSSLQMALETRNKYEPQKFLQALEKENDRFSALLIEIVKSDPFQKRTTPEK